MFHCKYMCVRECVCVCIYDKNLKYSPIHEFLTPFVTFCSSVFFIFIFYYRNKLSSDINLRFRHMMYNTLN